MPTAVRNITHRYYIHTAEVVLSRKMKFYLAPLDVSRQWAACYAVSPPSMRG